MHERMDYAGANVSVSEDAKRRLVGATNTDTTEPIYYRNNL